MSITVRHLRKSFRVKEKRAGLAASWRSLWQPQWRQALAIKDISFAMESGEALGFIGPNGAGKSTTIKILCGILHPDAGTVEVLGRTPWRDRRNLCYDIGAVFGQRPQLWYHLPPLDSFRLFGAIYGLDAAATRKRVDFLVEIFELEPLLHTPVRKLSLGQRMRCEVAVSLLHGPRLLLLDEPSIGLDVVAKQRIRDTVRRMQTEEGVGILLTSHDAGDIEALCERVIVISDGRLIFNDDVAQLKRRYLTSKRVDARFATEGERRLRMPGVETLSSQRYALALRLDPRQAEINAVIAGLSELGSLVDVTISDPSLEEIIRTIYAEDDRDAHDATVTAPCSACRWRKTWRMPGSWRPRPWPWSCSCGSSACSGARSTPFRARPGWQG